MRALLYSRSISSLIVCLALTLPAYFAHAEDEVVLHPLKGLGVDDDTVDSLERIIYNEFAEVPGLRLVGVERTREHVQEHEVDCDGDDECLANLADALGATLAAYGVVGGLGDSYTITLKTVDAATMGVRSRVELRVGGEREVLIDGIRAGAYQLLRPDLYVGSLQLELPEDGADVYVDGELVGTTPLTEPVTGLEPGRRALKIVKKGFQDFDRFIEIRFQRTSVVTIDLESSAVEGVIYEDAPIEEESAMEATRPEADEEEEGTDDSEEEDLVVSSVPASGEGPAEAEPRIAPLRLTAYALVAGGVATLAAAGHQGFSARSQEASLEEKFADQGGPVLDDYVAWDKAYATADRANLLYLVGGVVTAAGTAVLVVDVLRGRAASDDALDVGAGGGFYVAPSRSAGGLGLTVSLNW